MLLELIRTIFVRRCPAIGQLSTVDFPRCELARRHLGDHEADRGMEQLHWREEWR